LTSVEDEHCCPYQRVFHSIQDWPHLLARLWIHSRNSIRSLCIMTARITTGLKLRTNTTVVMMDDDHHHVSSFVPLYPAFQHSFLALGINGNAQVCLSIEVLNQSRRTCNMVGGRECMGFFLGVSSYLVLFCFPASKVWDLQLAYFPLPFSRVVNDHKLGWASFPLLHAMHCKYGFMRIYGRMEEQMVGGVFTRFIALLAVEEVEVRGGQCALTFWNGAWMSGLQKCRELFI
jgi:hypothetical protein